MTPPADLLTALQGLVTQLEQEAKTEAADRWCNTKDAPIWRAIHTHRSEVLQSVAGRISALLAGVPEPPTKKEEEDLTRMDGPASIETPQPAPAVLADSCGCSEHPCSHSAPARVTDAQRADTYQRLLTFVEDALAVVQRERDEYKALAAVGTWHADCRPNREMAARELAKSQAVIDKLADRITELEAARAESQRALVEPSILTAAAHILRECAQHIQSLSVGYGAEQMKAIAAKLDSGYSAGHSYLLAESKARYEAQRQTAALRSALEQITTLAPDRHSDPYGWQAVKIAQSALAAGTETT